MDIKNKRILALFLSGLLLLSLLPQSEFNEVSDIKEDNLSIKTSSDPLVDKVYVFENPSDSLEFQLSLERKYDYWIYIEIVSPDVTLDMNVSIWDPDGKYFHAFSRTFYVDQYTPDYIEFPFGVAVAGVHTIQFNSECTKQSNIYIRIERTVNCLYDKISQEYIDGFIQYNVLRFSNDGVMEFTLPLESDRMYRLFIGRVSPLAYFKDWEVLIDYNITYPNHGDYIICEDLALPRVTDFDWTFFGTADKDIYTLTFKIKCNPADMPNVNIAFAVADNYQITDIIDENGTLPDSPNSQGDILSNYTILPETSFLIMVIVIAGMSCVGLVVFISKRKNAVLPER